MPDDFVSFPSRATPYALYYPPFSMRFYATLAARDTAWAAMQVLLQTTPHPAAQGEPCCGEFATFLPGEKEGRDLDGIIEV